MAELFGSFSIFIIAAVFFLFSAVKILSEWERAVVLRLGRSIGVKGPGLIILIPILDRLIRVDTRTVTMDVPTQDIITRDNVSMKVNAVIYFRVTDPVAAITEVEDYIFATSQLSQTTLRSIMGQFQMDEILSQRESINVQLQKILDDNTEKWGMKIAAVELKHIDLPKEMQRAMARQAEAERERRAKIISAEGELQRAEKLAEAAKKLAESPAAIQLAYLQTLTEISGDKTNTIIFPLPMDQLGSFLVKK
jgi:regulator of protease activity HflC (stomatin/prohibitin superfamily)